MTGCVRLQAAPSARSTWSLNINLMHVKTKRSSETVVMLYCLAHESIPMMRQEAVCMEKEQDVAVGGRCA